MVVGTDTKITKTKSIIGISILLFISVAIGYFVIHFKQHHKIATGIIRSISQQGGGNNYTIFYEFAVNNHLYHSDNTINNICSSLTFNEVKQLLLNKKFPVAYDENFISYSMMIITLRNSSRLTGYKYPDSLLVYDSILTCKSRVDGSIPIVATSTNF